MYKLGVEVMSMYTGVTTTTTSFVTPV